MEFHLTAFPECDDRKVSQPEMEGNYELVTVLFVYADQKLDRDARIIGKALLLHLVPCAGN